MILRSPGAPIPLPPGAFAFRYPRAVFDSKGVYHLVWAEPARPEASGWRFTAPMHSLWHASIAVWHADSLIICFAGLDPSRRSEAGGLFTTVSGDGGLTWSEPRLVSRLFGGDDIAPTLILAGGRLHMIASVGAPGRFSGSALEHWEYIEDRGQWLAHPDAPLVRAQEVRFVAAGSACGSVVAAVESLDGSGRSLHTVLDEVRWVGDSVATGAVFPGFSDATSVGLLADAKRFLMVAIVVRSPGGPLETILTTRDDKCAP